MKIFRTKKEEWKLGVVWKVVMRRYRRGWTATLAESNEAVKLELPRAWEPLDKLKPSQNCEGTSSHSLFFDGD